MDRTSTTARWSTAESTAALRFLQGLSLASRPHSGVDLAAHLIGTRALLDAWGAREALCRAGLFHSVFGTEMFSSGAAPQGLREEVRVHTGPEAERIAWLFGVVDRTSFTLRVAGDGPCLQRHDRTPLELSVQDLADLANLYAANAVEQLPRLPSICAVVERAYLEPCAHLMLPAAIRALEIVRSDD